MPLLLAPMALEERVLAVEGSLAGFWQGGKRSG